MDSRSKQALVLGREHYERHEYDRAEALLNEALAAAEGYADVHNMLGVIHHERGDFTTALRFFERAVELNPDYTEALLNLAITSNDVGQFTRAREVFERTRKPGDREAKHADAFALGRIANLHATVAEAYKDAGRFDDAVAELEKALRLRPEFADLRVELATILREAGKLERAESELLAAIESRPKYVQARVLLGVTRLALKRPADAARCFRDALELDPEHKAAKMYLRFAERPRPPADAIAKMLEEIPDDWPSDDDGPTYMP
ncbi:MAG: tetratricopeptide repeat protein [Polyangiaceae bacterium]